MLPIDECTYHYYQGSGTGYPGRFWLMSVREFPPDSCSELEWKGEIITGVHAYTDMRSTTYPGIRYVSMFILLLLLPMFGIPFHKFPTQKMCLCICLCALSSGMKHGLRGAYVHTAVTGISERDSIPKTSAEL